MRRQPAPVPPRRRITERPHARDHQHPRGAAPIHKAGPTHLLHDRGEWHLTADQQRGLLGFPSTSTFYNYRNGTSSLLSADTLTRLSLVFGIYKDLKILYPEPRIHLEWVHMPNSNPLFADAHPSG